MMKTYLLFLILFQTTTEKKIDPRVESKMKSGNEQNVILLGTSQLFEGKDGFLTYCKENENRKRSELRVEIIQTLKTIASEEQGTILKALGNPRPSAPLWLVNAISLRLTHEQIQKAASLPEVKYIYPGTRVRMGKPKGKVDQILQPGKRVPFSLKEKKVPWNLKAIEAPLAWKQTRGEGIVIAMLDSGVRYTHPDLKDNIWINNDEIPNNGIDEDQNGYIDDLYGYDFGRNSPKVMAAPNNRGLEHGTVTSGIVAGDGTSGTITGVAPRAKIMPLKGGGTHATALAWQYALENGADIVNMSFSIPNLGTLRGLWRRMADHATCAGLVLVSGAGNFQKSEQIPVQIRIPEGIPSVICAGGINRDHSLPGFVSLGPVEWSSVPFYHDFPLPKGLIKPDLSAFPGPGYPILSSGKTAYIDPNRNIKGNSFSSPHIAGVAALVLSVNPEIPSWKVKWILEKSCEDIGKKGKDTTTGMGLINAVRAVNAAKE
jgi:subtilisin family serine protease